MKKTFVLFFFSSCCCGFPALIFCLCMIHLGILTMQQFSLISRTLYFSTGHCLMFCHYVVQNNCDYVNHAC